MPSEMCKLYGQITSLFQCTILYDYIDQILPNKLHGPMHYKIGVACVYKGYGFYTVLL